ALGFIGSALIRELNKRESGYDLVAVDDFYKDYKDPNLKGKNIREWIHRDIFIEWLDSTRKNVSAVIHMGARTDTAEQDKAIFDRLNVKYSKEIWRICTEEKIPLIYASSAATYGDGSEGFSDEHELTYTLEALNPYGRSKLEFDQWVLKQEDRPPRWYGLRFFNVFGPNEYHKGRMASVVYHAFKQIQETGEMKLFRSHREDYEDGEQKRDFIYIKDVVRIIVDLLNDKSAPSGIYNLGTGKARTFNDLVAAIFQALGQEKKISFIDTPEDIREAYQYYTQADMSKWDQTGVDVSTKRMEESVEDYVKNYLAAGYKVW
ncbi:MAG: ADP-glyceromanno-heptose 6-epimerase, partial [Saprospiraceae bacterium]|nr:ADP-glyceromanno-heptose 6-epimerase [Saprospiraceae bacterium]